MTVPFKFLPHEILNRPKPAPVIRIYPQGPHELFTPKPTEKPTTPPKLVTTICAHLWSQNPQATKKKKNTTQAHQTPGIETHKSTLNCCRPISHLLQTHQPPVADTIFTLDHHRKGPWPPSMPRPKTSSCHSSPIRAAAVFPVFALSQLSIPSIACPLPNLFFFF